MSEEENNKSTSSNSNQRDNDSTVGIIERADAVAKRLEEAEKRIDEKTARYEQLLARNLLSGKSEVTPVIVKQETSKEYADRIMQNKK